MRLTRIDASTPSVSADALAAVMARRGGRVSGIDGLLLHSPPLTHGWHAFFEALWSQCVLERRPQMLALLLVGHINRCAYQRMRHEAVARDIGMSEAEIAAVANWPAYAGFSATDRAVLGYAEAMTRSVQVPQPVFQAVRASLSERETLELSTFIAAYNMVSRLMEALELTP